MGEKDNFMKRLGFLAIAIGGVIFLAFIIAAGKGNWFFYLAGGLSAVEVVPGNRTVV